jgi:hypothetical protein
MKTRSKIFTLFSMGVTAVLLSVVTGCSDTSTDPPFYIDNPNVSSYDSIEVYEDSAAFVTRTGLNLLDGVNTIDSDRLRDCSLNDVNNEGMQFYLQNGELLNSLLPPGYETRFFQVNADMLATAFDTLSKVPFYTSFTSNDFTQNGTENWGYFNATGSLSSAPVYCFWLKGKKEAAITTNNVYGIIQPREATDRDSLNVYGYRMSFRVRINTNGENDFRKQILSTE